MRYINIILVLLLTAIGCNNENNIVGPVTTPGLSDSQTKDGIVYTLSVSKNKLDIFDALKLTITAYNQSSVPKTPYVGFNSDTMSIINGSGRTIYSGIGYTNNKNVIIAPQQSAELLSFGCAMMDIFRVPIDSGSYKLQWKMSNGLSFMLNLFCGIGENAITDSVGIISPIYPLKVGNKWTFRNTKLLSDGTASTIDTVTQTIIGETLIDGEKWFLLYTNPWQGREFITSRADGIYTYYSHLKTGILKYKYPVSQGEQYNSGYEEMGQMPGPGILVPFLMSADSSNESISVPGGQFICNKYHTPMVQMFSCYFYYTNPEDIYLSNIGPVKKIMNPGTGIYPGNTDPGYLWELISTNF
jgi:hypothetical protein